MSNKSIVIIIVLTVLIISTYFLVTSPTDEEQVKDVSVTTTTTTNARPVRTTSTPASALVFEEPTSENPGDQGNVRNQPAYLWSAITRGGVQTIGVDYVLVFEGEEAIQARLEDGVCTEEIECDSSRYIRNKNPHHRSLELSTTTAVTIEVNGALKAASGDNSTEPAALTFDELQTIVSDLPAFASTTAAAFKEPKTFVYLDIIGGGVTAIREP